MLDHLISNLDPEGDSSLLAQLRQSVVEAILSRAILPGDKLPSSRALADQLGISRNTVVLAYQALIDTGFIEARERSSHVVSSDAPVGNLVPQDVDDHRADALSKVNWDDKLVSSCSDIRPVAKPLNWREYPYPFVYGQVDDELFS